MVVPGLKLEVMIKAHRLLIDSLPDGARKMIAEEMEVTKSYVSQVLNGEVNPDHATAREIIDMAGSMAAREIFEFSWDLKKRGK